MKCPVCQIETPPGIFCANCGSPLGRAGEVDEGDEPRQKGPQGSKGAPGSGLAEAGPAIYNPVKFPAGYRSRLRYTTLSGILFFGLLVGFYLGYTLGRRTLHSASPAVSTPVPPAVAQPSLQSPQDAAGGSEAGSAAETAPPKPVALPASRKKPAATGVLEGEAIRGDEYLSGRILIFKRDSDEKPFKAPVTAEGSYRVVLPTGTYKIFTQGSPQPIPVVVQNSTTTLNLLFK